MMSIFRDPSLSCPLSILLLGTFLFFVMPARVVAQDTAPEASTLVEPLDMQATLIEVPDLIKTGEYDRAIELLGITVEQATQSDDFASLQQAYLLLIKTYIMRANYYTSLRDRSTAQLYRDEATRVTRECLQIHALRRTVPDPPEEYPAQMHDLFDDVRREIFGSFRIVDLQPPDATVIMDDEVLLPLPGEEAIGDSDLAVGPHTIVVQSDDHKTFSDVVIISAGSTLEKSYVLDKQRSGGWWLMWGSIAAVGIAGLAYGINSLAGDEAPADPAPLPEPPAPPAQ